MRWKGQIYLHVIIGILLRNIKSFYTKLCKKLFAGVHFCEECIELRYFEYNNKKLRRQKNILSTRLRYFDCKMSTDKVHQSKNNSACQQCSEPPWFSSQPTSMLRNCSALCLESRIWRTGFHGHGMAMVAEISTVCSSACASLRRSHGTTTTTTSLPGTRTFRVEHSSVVKYSRAKQNMQISGEASNKEKTFWCLRYELHFDDILIRYRWDMA